MPSKFMVESHTPEELARFMIENLRELHLFFPVFWPLLFWETEEHNKANPEIKNREVGVWVAGSRNSRLRRRTRSRSQTNTRFPLKTLTKNPAILSLYLPGVGLWNMMRGKL